jgi:hypothetical protein
MCKVHAKTMKNFAKTLYAQKVGYSGNARNVYAGEGLKGRKQKHP